MRLIRLLTIRKAIKSLDRIATSLEAIERAIYYAHHIPTTTAETDDDDTDVTYSTDRSTFDLEVEDRRRPHPQSR